MRHGKKFNHLGRTSSHRKALLSNMASSLILTKRITTTVAKAKELRKYIEPLITKAKVDTTHNRRTVFSYLQDKESIKILFDEIGEKVAERNGGYTRIIKLGTRYGDNAQVAIIELVDYNENLLAIASEEETAGKTRRRRRGGAKATASTNEGESSVEVVEEEATPVATAEEVIEAPALDDNATETPKEEKTEE